MGQSRRSVCWIAILTTALLAINLAACSAAAPAPAHPGSSAERAAVEAAMRRYAELLRTGPVDATVALFMPDGELLEPGMPALQGQEAIRAFLAPLAQAFVVEQASMDSELVEIFGDKAYQWGNYSQRAGERGKPAAEYRGRYVASWQRTPAGWRLQRLLVQPAPGGA